MMMALILLTFVVAVLAFWPERWTVALNEAFRVLGELLSERIGRKRPKHRTIAGENAEHRQEPGRG